ncbi:homoserine kinase [Curvivirga aplysinae]|uniref:homoserine kinase n=1 Tax=Curvivirga aplysinae TaxID=2529852 RepID=UPI0012BBA1B6|nr:homoserine kinase [Curvivirga aplysinae]MTI09965.1 homoserine kinase [Curvivirga aplysinae]
MAVYTEVSDADLREFLTHYDVGEIVSAKGIAEGVENSNYLLKTTKMPLILTLYEKRVNPDDLPFFLNLMDHLAEKGVNCPLPVHDKNGQALRELCGRPAAMISFLDGMSPKQVMPFHCAELGKAMAQFHLAGADFDMERDNALSVEGWRNLLDDCTDRADEVKQGLAAELEAEFDYLSNHWPTDLPRGVIHADLFTDNVFFLDKKLSGIIDFYFACTDFYAYDLAICLNAWCFERDGSFNITKAKQMLSGYNKVRALSIAEMEALPIFARGSSLRFLLTRLYDWLNHPEGALVKPKDPMEYYGYLKFHGHIKSPTEYGLEK